MATRLLLRPQTLGLGLGVSIFSAFHLQQRPIRLDSGPVFSSSSYTGNAKTPVVRKGGLNAAAVRQVSSGSIIGLAVSTFSKSLVIILGLLAFGIQSAESYLGIHIVPYSRLQKYFTNIDLRSAVQDNVAFKLSCFSTFFMAAFLQL
ncbi:hypothetical protein D0Z07_5172 [Hyphodiscus hymeniophilus]|uniref:Uncharacterized protein n=1 Tax=Hyphodiscus hymeniophilus TaxID=353542 RepID=A0A9P6VID4_9HELO|nr:hypothetical protein D0Z07_5172 [Hyphodiscus hymeniophilus]